MPRSKKYDIDKIIGTRFNRLVIIGVDSVAKNGTIFTCKCDCGNTTLARFTHLISGRKQSCKCYLREMLKARAIHGQSGKTVEYSCWSSMINRCTNKKCKKYKDYGGRGIGVCQRWLNSFESFFEDMGKRPSKNHSIDRIINEDGYCPENCRWATKAQQSINRRNNLIIEINGERKAVCEWATIFNVKRSIIYQRIARGWSNDRLFIPPIKY